MLHPSVILLLWPCGGVLEPILAALRRDASYLYMDYTVVTFYAVIVCVPWRKSNDMGKGRSSSTLGGDIYVSFQVNGLIWPLSRLPDDLASQNKPWESGGRSAL